jgi:hypothetical protein
MLGLVSLAVNNAGRELRLENLQDVQRISEVEVLNKFVGDLEYQFSLASWSHLDSPKLGVLD